jgi:hypothetical protein
VLFPKIQKASLQERIHVVAVSSQRIDDRCLNFSDPDPAHISTLYVERQNLSMRMGIRRFTRLTNACSKKLANHVHARALDLLRIHQTLRVTLAMEAGVTDRLWSLEDVVEIVGEWEAAQTEKSNAAL